LASFSNKNNPLVKARVCSVQSVIAAGAAQKSDDSPISSHHCRHPTASAIIVADMPKTPDQLFVALDALGIKHATVSHPPLFTVEQSRALRGQIPGGHTKNLFLRDKKYELYLVVAEEDAAIELKGLHRLLAAGGRFSFGSADLLREVMGVEPGAVTPLGAINDADGRVTVVLDAALMEHATINCHPLVNTMTTSLSRDDLLKFLRSTGHEPRIERISGALS
jgi:Ala-tRNA(Pro) deacylase